MPSSVIDSFVYDPARAVLTVTFVTGRVYAYEDVPREIHEAFRAARSKGRYFNECIRDRYRPTELTSDAAPERPSAQILPFRKREGG